MRHLAFAALLMVGCGGDPTADEGADPLADEADAREATGRSSSLRCGTTVTGTVVWGGMFGCLLGGCPEPSLLTSDIDQSVTLLYDGQYKSIFGGALVVYDASAPDTPVAQWRQWRVTAGKLTFWARANRTYKIFGAPVSGHEYVGTELENGKWVSQYEDVRGSFTLNATCSGPVACQSAGEPQAGQCLFAEHCTTRSVPGLCPGPSSVQCCLPDPAPVTPDPACEEGKTKCDDSASRVASCQGGQWVPAGTECACGCVQSADGASCTDQC